MQIEVHITGGADHLVFALAIQQALVALHQPGDELVVYSYTDEADEGGEPILASTTDA